MNHACKTRGSTRAATRRCFDCFNLLLCFPAISRPLFLLPLSPILARPFICTSRRMPDAHT